MNTKKNYIILTIGILAIGISVIGITFAWYSYSNATSSIKGSTTSEKPTIIFKQSEYVSMSNIMPINEEDRYNYGEINSFLVTLEENLEKYENTIEISLINIKIDNELKNTNYRYELLENDVVVVSGDFSLLESDKLILIPNKIINVSSYPYTYNYKLVIWLNDDGEIQNNLMNKEFSAKINVVSASKKKG